MSAAKIAISLNFETLQKVDACIKRHIFKNRSQAFQVVMQEKIQKIGKTRLADECLKLDPKFEQKMADEGLGSKHNEWPEY